MNLWNESSHIFVLNFSWCIAGDFTVISSHTEHKSCFLIIILVSLIVLMILSQKILFLMLILMVLNLLGTMGDLALLVVGARLDMCLVNFNWSHCFSSYFISHLPRICSNHSLLLIFVLSWTPTKTRIFRFENYWLEYAQCHSCHYIVKSS